MYGFGLLGSSASRQVLFLVATLVPATAWAQSSITLYGTVDAGLLYTNKSLDVPTGQNGGKQFKFVSSGMVPSVLGLRGQEDLGGGWYAKFDLESGIDLANGGFDNSNGNLFGREAWVSLSNNLGELKAGLQYSPFLIAIYESDPRSMSQFGSSITVYGDNTFSGAFVSNAISYESPKIAGFTGKLMYVLGGEPGDFQAGRAYSASLKYENGSLLLNAAIYDSSVGRDAALNQTLFSAPLEGRTIGAGYTISSLTLRGSFTNYKGPTGIVGGLVAGGDNNIWNLGFDFYVTPFLDVSSGVWYSKDPHDSDNHGLLGVVGVSYQLSRRTSLYANVGATNNHGRSDLGLTVDGALEGAPGTTVGGNVGVMHRF
jgi:predicted porin